MPVIKSAKKKQRQDKKREARNSKLRNLLKDFLKKARKNPTEKSIKDAVITADKAVKKNLIHKNKAARIKSSLSKLGTTPPEKTEKTVAQKAKSTKKTKKSSR